MAVKNGAKADLETHLQAIIPEDNMAEAGRKILLHDFIAMLNHEDGSRLSEDIEDVHKMRVATRRMRAAFRLLDAYYKDKPIRPFMYQLKQIARRLGAVRDIDVMLEDLQKQEQTEQITALIKVLNKKHSKAHKRLVKHLDSKEYAGFVRSFGTFLTKPGKAARPIDDIVAPHQVRHVLPGIVHDQLATVKAYDTVIGETNEIETLHSLRIEFKRLRYLVEFFQEVLGNSLADFVKDLKAIQDHLGRLNDLHTFQQTVQALCEDAELEEPTDYIERIEAEIQTNMTEFQAVWQKFTTRTVQSRLSNALLALR